MYIPTRAMPQRRGKRRRKKHRVKKGLSQNQKRFLLETQRARDARAQEREQWDA